MKCPKCTKEMTDKQTVEFLEKEVARLELELTVEKLKAVPFIPYVPYKPPLPGWNYSWEGEWTHGGPQVDTPDAIKRFPALW